MNALICDRANTIQQKSTNADLGNFQKDQNAAIANEAFRAQSDKHQGDTDTPVYLVPAGTGTGKTTFFLSLVIACAEFDQTYSAAIVVPTVKQAQEAYNFLVRHLSDDSVYIHTSVHGNSQTSSVREEHGDDVAKHIAQYGPSSAGKLREYPIIICTHERWLLEGKGDHDLGIRKFKGSYRKNTFIDEMPSTVSTFEITPAEIRFSIEQVERLPNSDAAVATLKCVQTRMEQHWETKGGVFESCELINAVELMVIDGLDANELPRDCSHRVQRVIEFLRLAKSGYCILVRGHAAGKQVNGVGARKCFVAYRNDFTAHPGLLIFDATATHSSLARTHPKIEIVQVKPVDYGNLQATHFAMPEKFKNVASESASQNDDEFLLWVKHVVTKHTNAGDEILVVLHKRHVEAWSKPERVVNYRGRKLHLAYWGNGIGSNEWRTCGTVFEFSEYHKPRHSYVTEALAWRKETATTSGLASAIGQRATGHFKTTRDDHLLRCFKQMACRGTARAIGENGRAAPMRLFTCMDRRMFMQGFNELFHGAKEPSFIKDEQAKPKTKPQKVEAFLTREKRLQIPCSEVATKLDIKVKEVGRAFESPNCAGLRFIGWTLKKGDGKRSQPFLQRTPIEIKTGMICMTN